MIKLFLLGILVLFPFFVYPQFALKGGVELGTVINSSRESTAFWLRANRYGEVPINGSSAYIKGNLKKPFFFSDTIIKPFDWSFSIETRANFGLNSNVQLIDGFISGKFFMFEAKLGRTKEFLGLTDSNLSLGSFAISGNALGIPKVELCIPNYWPKNTSVAVKGNFSHGWYGYIPSVGTLSEVDSLNTYLHQKSLWIRFGKPKNSIRFFSGFSDNALWGDEYKLHSSFNLSKAQRYWSVISGKVWENSKVGNHLGTIDARIEIETKRYIISTYRQFFYDVGALWHLANVSDGLMGLTIEDKQNNKSFILKKVLFEFLYTKNQGGEEWSKPTPTGNENYYNHYIYNYGWSYKGQALGIPLITTRTSAIRTLPYIEKEYFVNNRLWAANVAIEINFSDWAFQGKLTYSKNYGTRLTEKEFPTSPQTSLYFMAKKTISSRYTMGTTLAIDSGELLPNCTTLNLYLSRSLNFK